MKTKLFLLISLTLLIFSCRQKDDSRIIDYPEYKSSNTQLIEVYRLEMTDSTFILHTNVYNNPNYWIKIVSDTYLQGATTGKSYKLLSSPDFELDTEVYMPESGNKSATFIFEAVDPQDKSVDFVEGDDEVAFRINGISLLPRATKAIRTMLTGEVFDRPNSSRLILGRKGSDWRVNRFISIPIHEGKFSYPLYVDEIESYELIFWDEISKGSWYPVSFIAEPGDIHFKLYPPGNVPRSIVETKAPFTTGLLSIYKETDSLFDYKPLYEEFNKLGENDRLYSQEWMQWSEAMDKAENGEARDKLYRLRDELEEAGKIYSPEGIEVENKIIDLSAQRTAFLNEYIRNNPNLTGYSILVDLAQRTRDNSKLPPYLEIFEAVYRERYPDHPYTADMDRLAASSKLGSGGSYIDFTAPDLDGNPVTLSSLIDGKVALIDLWASWCGPCRRLSISMIPVYNEFKDKGFVIVGVARENNKTSAMEKAISQDGYPWLNLVELNDEGKIWEKYGIKNSGGSTFLVDKNGKILAIHPTAEEVRNILKKHL